MRLPRRVPWSSLAELDEVCAWIYTDENDLESKVLALNRLSAWRSTTQLPHALEAALSILSAVLQDASSQSSITLLSLRQSYATALIRLVNGLVDSLQVGAYARSIASIAAQLGLPPWFVELRHSATHEDLPSLEVLQTAAREAMRWLLDNYFLPTLHPSAQPAAPAPSLRPLTPLLQRYKTLFKAVTRDASLRTRYKSEITKVLRDIERWIAEAKISADASLPALDWDGDQDAEQDDPRERWMLDLFCDYLIEPGVLVPLSKKKRSPSVDAFEPPEALLQIWTVLITHVCAMHGSLASVLVSKIIAHLNSASGPPLEGSDGDTILLSQEERDNSYDVCLATWANWLVKTFDAVGQGSYGDGTIPTLSREEVVISLLSSLRPDKTSRGGNDKVLRKLLKVLCHNHPSLDNVASLIPTITSTGPSTINWRDEDLVAMSQRLNDAVRRLSQESETQSMDVEVGAMETELQPGIAELPPGWRKFKLEDGWRPAPIGVFSV